MTTAKTWEYVECQESEIPAGVRFDVPRANQGQIVEEAYGGFSRCEHDYGDPYYRYHDRGAGGGPPRYYRRVDA